jgi:hypothetical protein
MALNKSLDQSAQLRQDIQLIEENIKTLEKRYTDYIEGVTSIEPKALRARTDALVRKWWGKPIYNTQFRFKVQNLVQRYNTYKEKWDRHLRIKARNEREDAF